MGADETSSRKPHTREVMHVAGVPDHSAIIRLYDGRARAHQPTTRAVNECSTQQQMPRRQSLLRPMRAAVIRNQNDSAFTKDPAPLSIGKDRMRETRVYICARQIHATP